jgi:hypothetical protein
MHKIRDFDRQFHPPVDFYHARQQLITIIKELKINVEVPLLVVEEMEEEDDE